jgi:hypothetical protein
LNVHLIEEGMTEAKVKALIGQPDIVHCQRSSGCLLSLKGSRPTSILRCGMRRCKS